MDMYMYMTICHACLSGMGVTRVRSLYLFPLTVFAVIDFNDVYMYTVYGSTMNTIIARSGALIHDLACASIALLVRQLHG
jgi:hypothetical protein